MNYSPETVTAIKQEAASWEQKPTYLDLPPQVSDFSVLLSETTYRLIEGHPHNQSLDRSGSPALFTRDDPSQKTRYGGPIVHLPQTPKFHRWDTLAHSDYAAAVLNHIEAILAKLGLSAEDVRFISYELYPATYRPELCLAGEVHDIEKTFLPSAANPESWSQKAKTSLKLNLLTGQKSEKEDEGLWKRSILTHIIGYDLQPNDPSFPMTGIDSLKEAFNSSGFRPELVGGILEVYCALDRLFIEKNGNIDFSIRETWENLTPFLQANIDISQQRVCVGGLLVMTADIVSQFDPPEATEVFWAQKQTALNFCLALLNHVLHHERH